MTRKVQEVQEQTYILERDFVSFYEFYLRTK